MTMDIDDLVERTQARLEAFERGETAAVLDDRAVDDADSLWQYASVHFGDGAAATLVAWLYWYRYGSLPRGEGLPDLAQALRVLFEIGSRDLQAVPDAFRALVAGAPDSPADAERQGDLALELITYVVGSDDRAALDHVIQLLATAVAALPPDRVAPYLPALGLTRRVRFRHAAAPEDIDGAVAAERQLIALTHDDDPDKAGHLSSLVSTLMARFDSSDDIDDIDEAIALGHESLRLAHADDPDQALYLYTLASAYGSRAVTTGQVADFDSAVDMARRAISDAPPDTIDVAASLHDFSELLQIRFELTGDAADLDEAVDAGRAALAAAPLEEPEFPGHLSNLGNAHLARFDLAGESDDLHAAVHYAREAVAAAAADHPKLAGYLSNLGLALRTRFDRDGEAEDIDEAVAVGRQAVQTTPAGHPDRAAMLTNLCGTLRTRFSHHAKDDAFVAAGPDLSDVDEAVHTGGAAMQAVPENHPNRGDMLSNLAGAHRLRYRYTSDLGDLEEAISLGRENTKATPQGHPSLATYLTNLGNALEDMFRRTGDIRFIEEAVVAWSQAAAVTAASAEDRIRAARFHAEAVAEHSGPAAAVGAYQAAIALLPLLAWRGISPSDQRRRLDESGSDLARDAAACAIAAGQPALAVELLEHGRGVLWAQLLDNRSDLSQLRQAYPELAAALTDCRNILDQPVLDDPAVTLARRSGNPRHFDDTRRKAARRFDALVAQVRSLPPTAEYPDPQSFLRPPDLKKLLPGSDRRVIIINISRWRCDALVVTGEGVSVIELPGLYATEVTETANIYLDALHELEFQHGLLELAINSTLHWLWDHITAPIISHLGYRASADALPRVWWCPTGVLTLLPIHAAGYHTDGSRDTVLDCVISSYTPTLRSLAGRRSAATDRDLRQAMLVVSLPNTPDSQPLAGAISEQRLLGSKLHAERCTVLPDAQATRSAILRQLPHHRWLHASCHGTYDLANPALAGLVPYDWQPQRESDLPTLITIGDLTAADQPGGDFAFLSACKTATNSVVNADEVLTIAAAMHHAGWRHVIGTLWTVWDDSAAALADILYDQLIQEGILDPTRAAQAMHHAARQLRDSTNRNGGPNSLTPTVWAPFIHIGP